MNYTLRGLTVGAAEANCYILGCARTHEAVIIDPGADDELIKKRIAEDGLKPQCIINTHGHIDHIGANAKFELPVLIHKLDAPLLTNPLRNMSIMLGRSISSPAATKLLEDGDKITFGDLVMEVMLTPGHTPGSICLKVEDLVFTGDTLFAEGVGRTDLLGGSENDLIWSIKQKLFILPDETKVYPGHGPSTTIGHEKRHNPSI